MLYNRARFRAALTANSNYPDGMTRNEALEIYKALIEAVPKEPSAVTALAEAVSWFDCDTAVVKIGESIDGTFEHFENLRPDQLTEKELKDFDTGIEQGSRNIEKAMVSAITSGGCRPSYYVFF
jgi:hypothetical protein